MARNAKKPKEFSKDREFAAILEKVYTEIRVIGEGQSVLKDKLDSAMGMVAKNSEGITWLKILNSSTKDGIDKINGKLATIEEGVRKIKESVKSHQERITRLEAIK